MHVKKLRPAILSGTNKKALGWIGGFAVVGLITLALSHAATPFYSIEPEDGTLTGNVAITPDDNASKQTAVLFKLAGSGGGGTGSAGCGFAAAAFCEDFSGGPKNGGRAGQMDPAKWSVTRYVGQDGGPGILAYPPTPASACRSGVTTVEADNDLLVCDSASGHLGQMLLAYSAQNYGIMSMRPRQPFDFAGRTGTVAFNTDAVTEGGLSWWPSVFITDQPTSIANNTTQVTGLLPKNGVGMNFDYNCGVGDGSLVGVGQIFIYKNYVETVVTNNNPTCVSTQHGALNHIEVRVSQTNVEVWASDKSTTGGTSFPALKRIFASAVSLPITRGYVHYQVGQRAPEKYKTEFNISPGYANYYWSGLGFDGPVISTGEVGYMVPDPLIAAGGGKTIASGLPGSFTMPNVSVTGVATAQLSFVVHFTYTDTLTPNNAILRYSLNGNPVRTPTQPDYNAQQFCAGCPGPTGGGGVLYNFPVALSDLRAGSNTLSVTVDNSPGGWVPLLASLDLLTFTANAP